MNRIKIKNMSLVNRIKQSISGINFFQIYFENKIGNSYDDLLSNKELKKLDRDKIIRIKNNDSFLTPDNWSNHKETFFNQRMESYKSSFTIDEKINLELENIELTTIDKTDHKILKERYKAFLLNRLEQPQQKKTIKPIKTLNDYFINIDEDNKEDFYKDLKVLFPTEKGKSIKVIIDELKVQNMLVIGAREFKAFHAELMKTFNREIGTYQSIQDVKTIDEVTSEPIKIKLNSLIFKYKSN
jgi:hypothetical protein